MSSTSDQNITADSFIFRELATPVDKKKITRRRRDPKNARIINSQLIPRTQTNVDLIQQDDDDPVSSAQRATILNDVHVYIDKALYNDVRISSMAASLGASVAETLNPSVTHVIHGPMWQNIQQSQLQSRSTSGLGTNNNMSNANKQRHPRLVTQALDRGMRVVSPTWIFECYERKQRLPEHFYPYNMNAALRLRDHQPTLKQHRRPNLDNNDNIFGLPHDELVSSDTDNDKTDDGHEETDEESYMKEVHDPGDGFDMPHDTLLSAVSSISTSMAPVVTSSSEEMARLETRKKRTAEIAKLKEQRKRQLQRQDQSNNDQKLHDGQDMNLHSQLFPEETILHPANFAGKERVDIWYGEQSFYDDHGGLAAVGSSTTTAAATPSRRAGQQRASKNRGK
ncbi:hypothetical protein BX666DRAFT_1895060 [Dichotomocladium elegans]|nr:hypothetical protein BX666DRAFT_1895060 [Dichotomocladium elegans]